MGFPRIYFNNGGDKEKLLTIEQWGTGKWRSMGNAFSGCSNLVGQAADAPYLWYVKDMSYMFTKACAFNQDIGTWNTASVTNMDAMFASATTFNQDIGGWDVAALTSAGDMFKNVKLSTQNYDALLIGWDAQTLLNGVTLGGGNSNYCLGAAAREHMISSDGWKITDGGQVCPVYLPLILK